MKKKFFPERIGFSALLLAGAMIFQSINVYGAAENGISVSEHSLGRGDEFKVSIGVPAAEDADTASLRVEFDPDAFEVTEWSAEVSGGVCGSGDGFFSLAAANAYRLIELGDGLELTASVRVKDTAEDGEYSFELTKAGIEYVDDDTLEFIELWAPEVTNVTVTVGSPPHADSEEPVDEAGSSLNGIAALVIAAIAVLGLTAVLAVFGISKSKKRR